MFYIDELCPCCFFFFHIKCNSTVLCPHLIKKSQGVQKQICSKIHMNSIHLCKETLLVESPLGAESSRILSLEVVQISFSNLCGKFFTRCKRPDRKIPGSISWLPRRACALRALGLLLADGAPTVGRGKTFWWTPERKVEKSIPRWEINRHAEG